MSKLLHQGFLHNAAKHPDRTALIDGESHFSYRQLLEQALHIAAGVNKAAVGSLRPIAISGDKSARAVAAILGVLLSGRAYSYLLPSQKVPRLASMVGQLRPALLLDVGAADLMHEPNSFAGDTPVLKLPELAAQHSFEPVATPEGCAYVLFTSGSTGGP